jgi:hypothetical protein
MLFLPYKFFIMKKILGLLIVSVLFAGCDDGNVVVESIDLKDAKLIKCAQNNILFKINSNQSMLLEIKETTILPFKNETGIRTVAIDNSINKLLFRTYNGDVKETNICGTTLDAFPSTKEEWIALYGNVEVNTTVIKTEPNTNNATRIKTYNHAILLKNIGWQKPDGTTQQQAEMAFGVYQTNPDYDLAFGFDSDTNTDVIKSSCDKSIFNFSGRESLRLKLDDATYNSLFTNVPSTKNALLNNSNTLTYSLFNNLINNAYFCTSPLPSTPILLEEWKAENGISDLLGTISVVTSTQTSTQFKHTITLKGVTFKKGNVSFYYGETIEMGSFITP